MVYLVFLILLILKLVGIITWSWWIVTMPLWLSWGLALFILILISMGIIICEKIG